VVIIAIIVDYQREPNNKEGGVYLLLFLFVKGGKMEEKVTKGIQEFMQKFEKTYGTKYKDRILRRLTELKEVRKEYNDSRYTASSKQEYIVFFKDIPNAKQFQYVLEHELFHFIQEKGSKFEKIPEKYEGFLEKNMPIALWEEAFVQYFTACINQKKPEYVEKDKNGSTRKYWLNEYYKEIVGIVEELEEKIGRKKLFDMYMDDNCYEKEMDEFDKKFGENAFGEYIQRICQKDFQY